MEKPPFYTALQEFLDRAILDYAFIYIDFWSFVHLTSGVLLGLIFIRFTRAVFALAWAVGFILAYELIELALNGILFVAETPVDTIWDVIVGFAGAFVALRLGALRKGRQKRVAAHAAHDVHQ
jgi:hypothetical protein